MRSWLSGVVLVLLATLMGLATNALREEPLPIFQTLPEFRRNEIGLEDAFALFAQKRAVFLDARSAVAFSSGNIIGSLNIPPEKFEIRYPELLRRLQEGSSDAPLTLITYCDGPRCPKAQTLAARLNKKGQPKIVVLKDGFAAWKKGGYPTR